MYNGLSAELKSSVWLMYLRKSRQDDPNETVEEVLAKHEGILQAWARRELGYEIPQEYIFREVISGESIAERTEIQKVLSMMESSTVAGVIVVDPQRLSRGDLMDCGTIMNTLLYTKSLVATPMQVYNMENKMERRFFQDELMRGRDYLEYTKEILARGRLAAVINRGCYIGSVPPYGYDKTKIGKDHTLVPNEAEADVVKLIFNWFVRDGMTTGAITRKLNDMGIKPRTKEIWYERTVNQMLGNQHYIGRVVYYRRKREVHMEDGKPVKKRMWQPEENVLTAEGKHEGIIDPEIFAEAQKKRYHAPRVAMTAKLTNPLAGILVCSKCGHSLIRHPYGHAEDRLGCRYHRPACMKSVKLSQATQAVIDALEYAELPKLQAMLDNRDGDSLAIQKRMLASLEKQMEEYRQQEETQYELLETKKYTQELFDRRNSALREKMKLCEAQIAETKKTMPEAVDYAERIVSLKECIDTLKDCSAPCEKQNKLLHKVVDRIEVTTAPAPKRTVDLKLNVFLRL